jgi:filamentous hemagglutinin
VEPPKAGEPATGPTPATATESGAGGLGKAIAEGHAFEKHVIKKGEFKGLGIKTPEEFAKHIDVVVARAKGPNVRQLSQGRTAYWDEPTGTVVISNPKDPDSGTAFRPSTGRKYFEGLK